MYRTIYLMMSLIILVIKESINVVTLVSEKKSPIVFNIFNFNKLQGKNYFSIRTRKFAERH